MTRFLRSFICLFVVRSLLLSACSPAVPPKPIAEMQTQVAQESLTMTSGSAPVQIHGAGAAFPLFIYSEWMYAYSFVEPTVEIDYQGMGSGAGKKAILAGAVDFAGSNGSGTIELFTKSLASFSPEWTVGSATTIDWPVDKVGNGLGAKGNQGVTEAESLAAAMNDFGILTFNDKLTATIVDGDGNGSWPSSLR